MRVPVPKASKETKEATVKLISKIAEAAKTRVRRVRQAAMEKLKKAEGACYTSITFPVLGESTPYVAASSAPRPATSLSSTL